MGYFRLNSITYINCCSFKGKATTRMKSTRSSYSIRLPSRLRIDWCWWRRRMRSENCWILILQISHTWSTCEMIAVTNGSSSSVKWALAWITIRCDVIPSRSLDRLTFRNILDGDLNTRRWCVDKSCARCVFKRPKHVFKMSPISGLIFMEWFIERDQHSWTVAFHIPFSVVIANQQPYAIFFKLSIFTFRLNYFTHHQSRC